jgi:type 1 glutamine amidotransferase
MTDLPAQIRGDSFEYKFTLGGGWKGSDFTDDVKFTLRTAVPDSSIVDDSGAVYQASETGGQITFSGGDPDEGTIAIPAADTKDWPACRKLFWDLQVTITAGGKVYTLDIGEIPIIGDITRS